MCVCVTMCLSVCVCGGEGRGGSYRLCLLLKQSCKTRHSAAKNETEKRMTPRVKIRGKRGPHLQFASQKCATEMAFLMTSFWRFASPETAFLGTCSLHLSTLLVIPAVLVHASRVASVLRLRVWVCLCCCIL